MLYLYNALSLHNGTANVPNIMYDVLHMTDHAGPRRYESAGANLKYPVTLVPSGAGVVRHMYMYCMYIGEKYKEA